MPPVKVPNYNKWNRPPTAVYEGNYGYGINFYQPMIDYISAKEHGVSTKPPHLPWNNERGLEKYRTDRPVEKYSEEDVSRISKEVADHAKQELTSFQVTKRTPFSVVATAAAANVGKHVGVESVTVKGKRTKVNREKFKAERQKKRLEEIENELDLYDKAANVSSELRGKAMMYRGKSATAIAQVLLDESRKNIAQGHIKKMDFNAKKEAIDRNLAKVSQSIMSKVATHSQLSSMSQTKLSEQITETVRSVRATSPVTKCVIITSEIPIIDNSYVQKIQDLRETLNQFEKISTSLCIDKRYYLKFKLNISNIYSPVANKNN